MNFGLRYTCLFLLLALPAHGAQASGGLELEVAPQSLELSSCQHSSSLLVIVRNPTPYRALDLELSIVKDLPIEISLAPPLKVLGPSQQTSWKLDLKCISDFPAGSVQVVLSSKLASGM